MIAAFFESIKYVGNMIPLALLRLYIGYDFFASAMEKTHGDYLIQPRLAAQVSEWLPRSHAPLWYKALVSDYVIESWRLFSYLITYCEFLIAVSFLLGFFVRPVAILGFILSLNLIYMSSPQELVVHQLHSVIFLTMLLAGAGRSFGIDYFFFKRQRGLWW